MYPRKPEAAETAANEDAAATASDEDDGECAVAIGEEEDMAMMASTPNAGPEAVAVIVVGETCAFGLRSDISAWASWHACVLSSASSSPWRAEAGRDGGAT